MDYLDREVPIPPMLHSFEHGGPFEKCLVCSTRLHDAPDGYLIQRVFRNAEPIIEYAMCASCMDDMQNELSRESRDRIGAWVVEHVDLRKRRRALYRLRNTDDMTPLLQRCIVTQEWADDQNEWEIAAWCVGDRMRVQEGTPVMLCSSVIESLSSLCSQKTREWMEDFIGNHFGMPPEFCDEPDLMPILI